jgi:hypothetical protein
MNTRTIRSREGYTSIALALAGFLPPTHPASLAPVSSAVLVDRTAPAELSVTSARKGTATC